jgi:hypothetical protein
MSPDEPIDPANDTERPPPVVPAGFAQHALSLALDDVHRALMALEALADSYARQLDSQATEGAP